MITDDYLSSIYGQELFKAEIDFVKNHINTVFGFHILQIGSCELDYLSELEDNLKIRHKLILLDKYNKNNSLLHNNFILSMLSVLYSKENYLALDSESIDCVLLAHSLEFSDDPHSLIREIDRILVPSGHIIILGYNQYSLWGLRRLLTYKKDYNKLYPWDGKWYSSHQICDWLKLLNYQIELKEHFFYKPCINSKNIFNFIDKLTPKFLAKILIGSAAYCIVAKKNIEAFTPILINNTKWSRESDLVPSAYE